MAEWLGRGLQSLVQRFESARRLFSTFTCTSTASAPGLETELDPRSRVDVITAISGGWQDELLEEHVEIAEDLELEVVARCFVRKVRVVTSRKTRAELAR